jgi:hypothetical protein
MHVRVANAAEENFDLNIVFGGIASGDRVGARLGRLALVHKAKIKYLHNLKGCEQRKIR